jgi:hypothetical protein
VSDPDPSVRMPGDPTYVGNGTYNMTAPFVGLGIRWLPDWGAPAAPPPEELEQTEAPPPVEEPVIEEPVVAPVEVAPPAPEPTVVPEDQPDEPPARPRRRGRGRRRPR